VIPRPLFAASFILLLSLTACRKDVGTKNPGGYPQDIASIVVTKCAVSGCHNSESAQATAGFDMSSWERMFRGSTSGSPVIPFSSRFSSLCYFINTYSDLGPSNVPTMPLNRTPLPREDVELIKTWIGKGAPDMNGRVMWADNPRRAKLYAVNQGCDVVTVFDAESRLPMRFIDVGTKPSIESPHQVRVSPDGNYWYVIFINNNVMQKYRCSDDALVGNIPLTPFAAGTGAADIANWNTFAITSDGRKAYCVSWSQNGAICSVDLDNMKLIKFLGGQYNPHAIALSNDGSRVYVGGQTGNYLTAFDAALSDATVHVLENGAPQQFSTSLDPHDIAVSPHNSELWITCQGSDEVRVYNTLTNSVTLVVPVGKYPQEIVYSESGNCYFISCMRDSTVGRQVTVGTVARINAASHLTDKIQVGYQPHGLATDEARHTLYVLSRNITSGVAPHHSSACAGSNGFVEFVDIPTFRTTGRRYELSVDPYFISMRP
jgi:YVTN family beta-propeller protein